LKELENADIADYLGYFFGNEGGDEEEIQDNF
jgi:hypothetical protein